MIMEATQLKSILEEMRFSANLPPGVVEQLAAESAIQRVSAGAVVFREGSKNDNLYLVHIGRVALEMNFPGRGAVRILTLGPGEMVGWSSLLDHGKMTARAVAVEDTELVVAPAIKLNELSATNRDFGFHLMRQMAGALAKRLVATRLQLLDLFADTPPTIPGCTSDGNG
jgi:CRP-like cAMP-binding protein